MGIESPNTVDAVGIDKVTGEVVLFVFDSLPWTDSQKHLLLEGKINRYLGFIEHGELLESYPNAADKSVRIEMIFRFEPPDNWIAQLEKAQEVAGSYGVAFCWVVKTA